MSNSDIKEAAARRAADAQRGEMRTALLEERRGYVSRGMTERIKQVDAQLAALGEPEETEETESKAPAGDPPKDAPKGSVKARRQSAAEKKAATEAEKKAAEDAAAKAAAEAEAKAAAEKAAAEAQA